MDFRLSGILKAGLALLVFANTYVGSAQTPIRSPFQRGETLTYEVGWSVFTAGKVVARLSSADTSDGLAEITTTARSQGFASVLFKVHDDFHSFFNPQTLCTQRISKTVEENKKHRQIEIAFNPTRGVALYEERNLSEPHTPPKRTENKISGCVQDIVTAFYFLRRQPLRVGQDVHLSMNDGGQTHEITVEVQGREQLQTSVGNRMAFRVEPKIFETLYNKKGRLLVWFSDDEQRLPLRIKITLSVGTVTGNLKSVTIPPGSAPSKK